VDVRRPPAAAAGRRARPGEGPARRRTGTTRAIRAALLALAAGVAIPGPAAPAHPPSKLPRATGWIAVRSEHFTLYSNAGEARTRRVATQLERFRRALGQITRGFRLDAELPTSTLVFGSDADFVPYKLDEHGKPLNVSGYFLPRPFANFILLDAAAGSEPLRVVYHEYFHSVVDASVGYLPTWLEEGLAEYYSTFRERGAGEIELGHPIAEHLQLLQQGGRIPWDDVFATTPNSPTYNEGTRQGAFYAQSWLLVHHLAAKQRVQALGRYLTLLAGGAGDDAAFRQAFDADRATVGAAAEADPESRSRYISWDPGEPWAKVELAVRPLQPAEVLFRLGHVLAQRGQTDRARRHLDAAGELGWPQGPIHTALGIAAVGAGDVAQAEVQLRKAIETGDATAEPRVLLAQLILDRHRATPDAGLPRGETAPAVLGARELVEAALEGDPRNFPALIALAWTYILGSGDVAPGVAAVESARGLRPLASDTLQLHACLLARQGLPGRAWTVVTEELEPRDADAARLAGRCVVEETVVAVWERQEAGDLEAARAILEAATATTPDREARARLERLGATLASGGRLVLTPAATDERVAAYNAAGQLVRSGDYEAALSKLEQLLRDCGEDSFCSVAAEHAAQLRETIARNRAIDAFNEAVERAKAGDVQDAVAKLRELEQEVTDPELLAAVQDLLRRLGARVARTEP